MWNGRFLSDRLREGIHSLETYGFLSLSEDGTVIRDVPGDKIAVQKSEKELVITYDTEPHFYMALARSIGMQGGTHQIEAKAARLGLMLDCSRNAAATPDMIKRLICLMILAGYNYLSLYTEDTYELEDEPYFGHMRGRYSKEELREVIAFAEKFGMEVVPCIQTLAHLEHLNQWDRFSDMMDIDDILLAEDERTYEFIRSCIHFCKDVFHTERINIGTDEAIHLGRGRYTDKHGYKPKREIYTAHLKKVFAICREEGLKPEFWADAIYSEEQTDAFADMFDGTQIPIYWDYCSYDKEQHSRQIQKLKSYAEEVIYAGGLWEWIGFAPFFDHTDRVTKAAFEAALEQKVQDILMTVWGDDGAENSVFSVIPSMWYAAELLYPCEADVDKVITCLTGYTPEEWRLSEQLNDLAPEIDRTSNAAKCLFYNDFLLGLMDYHVPDGAGEHYGKLFVKFEELSGRNSQFSYLFEVYAKLCLVLKDKATYGKRLCEAYHENRRETLYDMKKELSVIQNSLRTFHESYRKRWYLENKTFGFEVMDIRIGGLITRADTVAQMLQDYLDGKVEQISELEEERISYWKYALSEKERYVPFHCRWADIFTANKI